MSASGNNKLIPMYGQDFEYEVTPEQKELFSSSVDSYTVFLENMRKFATSMFMEFGNEKEEGKFQAGVLKSMTSAVGDIPQFMYMKQDLPKLLIKIKKKHYVAIKDLFGGDNFIWQKLQNIFHSHEARNGIAFSLLFGYYVYYNLNKLKEYIPKVEKNDALLENNKELMTELIAEKALNPNSTKNFFKTSSDVTKNIGELDAENMFMKDKISKNHVTLFTNLVKYVVPEVVSQCCFAVISPNVAMGISLIGALLVLRKIGNCSMENRHLLLRNAINTTLNEDVPNYVAYNPDNPIFSGNDDLYKKLTNNPVIDHVSEFQRMKNQKTKQDMTNVSRKQIDRLGDKRRVFDNFKTGVFDDSKGDLGKPFNFENFKSVIAKLKVQYEGSSGKYEMFTHIHKQLLDMFILVQDKDSELATSVIADGLCNIAGKDYNKFSNYLNVDYHTYLGKRDTSETEIKNTDFFNRIKDKEYNSPKYDDSHYRTLMFGESRCTNLQRKFDLTDGEIYLKPYLGDYDKDTLYYIIAKYIEFMHKTKSDSKKSKKKNIDRDMNLHNLRYLYKTEKDEAKNRVRKRYKDVTKKQLLNLYDKYNYNWYTTMNNLMTKRMKTYDTDKHIRSNYKATIKSIDEKYTDNIRIIHEAMDKKIDIKQRKYIRESLNYMMAGSASKLLTALYEFDDSKENEIIEFEIDNMVHNRIYVASSTTDIDGSNTNEKFYNETIAYTEKLVQKQLESSVVGITIISDLDSEYFKTKYFNELKQMVLIFMSKFVLLQLGQSGFDMFGIDQVKQLQGTTIEDYRNKDLCWRLMCMTRYVTMDRHNHILNEVFDAIYGVDVIAEMTTYINEIFIFSLNALIQNKKPNLYYKLEDRKCKLKRKDKDVSALTESLNHKDNPRDAASFREYITRHDRIVIKDVICEGEKFPMVSPLQYHEYVPVCNSSFFDKVPKGNTTALSARGDRARSVLKKVLSDARLDFHNDDAWEWLFRWMGTDCAKWVSREDGGWKTDTCIGRFLFLKALLFGTLLYPFVKSDNKDPKYDESENVFMTLDDKKEGCVRFFGSKIEHRSVDIHHFLNEDKDTFKKDEDTKSWSVNYKNLEMSIMKYVYTNFRKSMEMNIYYKFSQNKKKQSYKFSRNEKQSPVFIPGIFKSQKDTMYERVNTNKPLEGCLKEYTITKAKFINSLIKELMLKSDKKLPDELNYYSLPENLFLVNDLKKQDVLDLIQNFEDMNNTSLGNLSMPKSESTLPITRIGVDVESLFMSGQIDKCFQECAKLMLDVKVDDSYYNSCSTYLKEILPDKLKQVREDIKKMTKKGRCVKKPEEIVVSHYSFNPKIIIFITTKGDNYHVHCVVGDKWFLTKLIKLLSKRKNRHTVYQTIDCPELSFNKYMLEEGKFTQDKLDMFRDILYTRYWSNYATLKERLYFEQPSTSI